MGQFTNLIQDDKIKGPGLSAFSPDRWNRIFAEHGPHDETDHRIFDAAPVIYRKFEAIRRQLNTLTIAQLSATTKLRAYVAISNYNFVHAMVRADNLDIGNTVHSEDAKDFPNPESLYAELKLKLMDGLEWALDEIVEGLVDGIEVAIKLILRKNPELSGAPRMNLVPWLEVAFELNMGIMYQQAEDIWDDCLWNGYQFSDADGVMRFFTADMDPKRGHALGLVRSMTLGMGVSINASKTVRMLALQGIEPAIGTVSTIEKIGKRQFIKIAKHSEITEIHENLVALRTMASKPYYEEILKVSLPLLEGLTLSEILDAWAVISNVVQVQFNSIKNSDMNSADFDVATKNWLPSCAPTLQIDALVDALFSAANINRGAGKRVIEFFTFKGLEGQELWDSPLVPVGPKSVSPVFAAIISPNLVRLVDVWLRRTGIDLDKRGPIFEAYIRDRARNAIAASEILSSKAVCLAKNFIFKVPFGEPEKEQIDFLLVIGSTVFLGESKCAIDPTDAKSIAMHRKKVQFAADQITRKAKALCDNREKFVNDVKQYGIDLPVNFSVCPLIILSTCAHVGVALNGVPVIDEYVLERYLAGRLEHITVSGPDMKVQDQPETIFYTNLIEAEQNATAYFGSPPVLQKLIKGISERIVPIQKLDEHDWEGFLETVVFASPPDGKMGK